jgi:tetratricopeptide (TPR) repeat protein/TolB-like protein
MKNPRQLNLFLVFSLFILLLSCYAGPSREPVYVKDGKEYGKVQGSFRHRWWNYYERGLSFQDGKFYLEALSDLKEAIQQREKDQRMARTYGMHFIDYFPHRERGIVYYEMGDLGAAKEELELSLRHYPSAKARYYLDQVRKSLIDQEGKDVAPPRLWLDYKTGEIWTRDDPVILSGVAEDEHFVSAITIGSVPLFLEGSQKAISFRKTLRLSQGLHSVEVEAKNLAGKVSIKRVLIHVDREGPTITLEEVQFNKDTTGKLVTIKGSVYDESNVFSLTINGRAIAIKKEAETFFTELIPTDRDSLELVARDRLGNQTSALIPLTPRTASKAPIMLACADTGSQALLIAGLFGSRVTNPPTIRLKGWTDTQTVFLEKIYLEGRVSDENRIEILTINEVSVLRRKGRHVFFNHLMKLREGKNTIIIVANDEAGNTATQKITVIRRIPKALQLNERLSLTAFPFEQKGAVSQASLAFQDNLIDALVKRNRFRVVERDRLDLILEEQKLSRTKLFDKRIALRLGRLVAAQSVITGSIIETRAGIEVVARMIDAETSEIIATEDVYDEVKDLPALMSLAEGMAIKFHRDFPLVDGLVIECRGQDIFTDLGQDVIKLQRRIIVYREKSVKHPVTGKVLGAATQIIGRARVTQVQPEMSKAELIDGMRQLINPLDKVITE